MTEKGEQLTVKGEFISQGFLPESQISVNFIKHMDAENTVQLAIEPTSLFNFLMVFAIKGDVHCLLGKEQKSIITVSSQQHSLIAIPNGVTLKPVDPNAPYEIAYINISTFFLSRYLPSTHPAFKIVQSPSLNEPVLFCDRVLHLSPEISVILNSIENSVHTGFCKRLFLESKVIELLALQLSQFEQAQNDEPVNRLTKEDLDKMHEVKEILIANIDSQFSLRTLAHMVGTNEFNLKRNFKAAFGTTVYGYFNQYKMEQAKMMLLEGDSKISEVSSKIGYKHATHFTSAFKKYFGYLPTRLKMSLLIFDPEICLFFITA
ncbi:MAG: AraC family transcriptional regulator [Pedobacter sp.]|uniref:helix-turn-helix domain-containing protein n=1 Tax=Pedobacter sp. TaxID=1411316 RepID=UPI0035659891